MQIILNFDSKRIELILSILSILFTGATLFFYIISLFISYKEKDFASLGNRSFFVNLIGFSLSLISILHSTVSMIKDLKKDDKYFILILVIQIILVGLVFFLIPYFYTRVLKIKSIFRLSHSIIIFEKQINELKNDPQTYSKYMDIFSMAQNNPHQTNQNNTTNPSDLNVDNEINNAKTEKPISKTEKIRIALEKLPLTNLYEIAKKLEISGYQDLKKQELIELLIRILGQQEK
ncbi:Putative uncharacterized protein [Mesomycoplasma hyopneumoniae 168]|uniref:Rho termination factor-like N-terminal domain-containing protein n=2 Tax=Mesomycoplasma hyopneumoniae (strain 168) TaxID=907287 RepID=E4QT24_MESH1|nr:Putative uncharacterized protein [Mesomycoplasma hyopneumoniae 168]AGM22150.1 hypothetical protein MHP168L_372 [Mesomycoplasma hyopneumoniae 168-L]MXR57042.1 hypothetical protein [Mesomycoplasma hyopneumoniae]